MPLFGMTLTGRLGIPLIKRTISHCRCPCHAIISSRHFSIKHKPRHPVHSFLQTTGEQFHPSLSFLSNASSYHHSSHERVSLSEGPLRDYMCELVSLYDAQQGAGVTREAMLLNHSLYEALPLVSRMKSYLQKQADAAELEAMLQEENIDAELKNIAKEDVKTLLQDMEEIEAEVKWLVVPFERGDHNDVIVEVSAGVGGQEAMLFAKELWDMYAAYALWRGWSFTPVNYEESDIGGMRRASSAVSGDDVYRCLKYESGVHRVQRVPRTESKGRIHTSTATVAVLPQPTEIDISISPKDLQITTCRAGGAGGQHVNTTDSAVRIIHTPTGTVVECQEGRSQIKNKEIALKILRSKLYEAELSRQVAEESSSRKLQVGSAGRSEKIRTYNYQQGRITDHRVGVNMHDLDAFFTGGESLDDLINTLSEESHSERLMIMLRKYQEKSKNKAEY